ncbi:MAG: transcriptional repressor [Actinobacteria bacterium]|nr:transcriptional repressor [Actinomycetota bacterium]
MPRRTTRQRTTISQFLSRAGDFRTAQQIHEQLRASGESIGLATVYRTLQSMAESGEVDVVRTADGESAYRRCATTGHHHHLRCRRCGRTEEIMARAVESWAATIAAEHGFTDVSHDVELYGLCAPCSAHAAAIH